MSDRSLKERLPYDLRLSITNLWEQLGQTNSVLLGLLINISFAATGVAIVLLFSNPVISTAGAAWAILNLIGIIKWVFGL